MSINVMDDGRTDGCNGNLRITNLVCKTKTIFERADSWLFYNLGIPILRILVPWFTPFCLVLFN